MILSNVYILCYVVQLVCVLSEFIRGTTMVHLGSKLASMTDTKLHTEVEVDEHVNSHILTPRLRRT